MTIIKTDKRYKLLYKNGDVKYTYEGTLDECYAQATLLEQQLVEVLDLQRFLTDEDSYLRIVKEFGNACLETADIKERLRVATIEKYKEKIKELENNGI